MLQYETENSIPKELYSFHNSDFIPSDEEKKRRAVSPGPGKYQTIDVIGKSSNTKSTTNYIQPFAHGKRFHN